MDTVSGGGPEVTPENDRKWSRSGLDNIEEEVNQKHTNFIRFILRMLIHFLDTANSSFVKIIFSYCSSIVINYHGL